jgi:serine/threonine-protein kinase TTK/MPS1
MGMILYFMTFGRLPFQHITNQYQLLFAICDSNTQIEIPIVQNQQLKDTLYVNYFLSFYSKRFLT